MQNNKPLLVDALHICMGGGLMILNHLVNNLVESGIDFVLLRDERCPQLESENKVNKVIVMSSAHKVRKQFYREHRHDYSKVLCFGNIPPTIKLDVPVFTYFHNVSLLKIPRDYPFKVKILLYLKKAYLRKYVDHTDSWIVQTSYTADLVQKQLARPKQLIYEYPFYRIPKGMNIIPKTTRQDYIFIGEYTGAKGHEYLLEAWVKLNRLGFDKTLHLTVTDSSFSKKIEEAVNTGVKIINHGHLDFSEIITLYNKSKATIYPSLNESLGLGIIEAVEAGCDVIGCNLPYIRSVCSPSKLFVPCDSDSIVSSVLDYEHHNSRATKLKIYDTISELLEFMKS